MSRQLYRLFEKKDKLFFIYLSFFSLMISIIETIGVGVIMPFINVASDFNLVYSDKYYGFIYGLFNFSEPFYFVVSFGFMLVAFYVLRGAINIYYQYMLARFAQGRYHLIASRLFDGYLKMPFSDFVQKNSSLMIKSIVSEAQNLAWLVQYLLFMLSEIMVFVLIYVLLLYVDWKMTAGLSVILLLKVLLMKKVIMFRIKRYGEDREEYQKRFYEALAASFGNFKIIKLLSDNGGILHKFKNASYKYTRVNIASTTMSHIPRLLTETAGFSVMALMIIYLLYSSGGDISTYLPMLSVYLLALYRLMPSISRVAASYHQVVFRLKALDIIDEELSGKKEFLGNKEIIFSKSIEMKKVSFAHHEDKIVLDNIDLFIAKNQKIAFVGESGAGKSTLIDIIAGLYRPMFGALYIDDTLIDDTNIKSWREKIGYIPQDVYLFDGSVADNILLGREFDEAKVIDVLKKANIYTFLMGRNGLDTLVGEGGIRLSGGQKQRIGIARALYGEPSVLILDEATSALDVTTEAEIMREIYDASKDKTLIVVTHRMDTIRNCDVIYRIIEGKVEKF